MEEKNVGPGYASNAVAVSSGHKGTVAIVIALLCALGVGVVGITTKSRMDSMAQKQAEAQQTSDQRFAEMESRWKATVDSLSAQLGTTAQELTQKAAALQKSQRVAVSRLSKQQQKAIEEVNTQVSGVKTDVDATKTDVANTKTDLEATKTKLEHTIGDLGVQSGLIALTRDQLEVLKHKGERNYYDVTLLRGKTPTQVSTVSLQLKKVDTKHNRFTVNVMADDKIIEKKDRTLAEPMQFYTGKDHRLYELVVFEVAKNEVSGYLSTPKEAPQRTSQ